MKRDSRLSSMLHVLLHMAHAGRQLTSEELARMLQTNPVVVRRTLSGLRERGLVSSEKGHGGGWVVARPLDAITLYDVYEGLGEPELFAIGHRSENSPCLVEKAVNSALDQTLAEAEALVLARLREVTLAQLSEDFTRNYPHAHRGRSHDHDHDSES
jgi:Rrf2 family protein